MASTNTTATNTSVDDGRFVFCERPRCPGCQSTEHKTTRSIPNGDGSRTQYKRCLKCGHAFRVVWD